MKEILKWIIEVRQGCKNTVRLDLEKIMKEMKKGNLETTKFNVLLQEIRDNERDDALLSLVEAMLEEELEKLESKEQ